MTDRETIINWVATEPGKAIIAGGLGGVVRWLTLRPTVKEGVITIVVGGICALYLGPIALPIVEGTLGKVVPGGDMAGLTSFLVGMGGISLAGMVLDVFDRRRRELGGKSDGS